MSEHITLEKNFNNTSVKFNGLIRDFIQAGPKVLVLRMEVLSRPGAGNKTKEIISELQQNTDYMKFVIRGEANVEYFRRNVYPTVKPMIRAKQSLIIDGGSPELYQLVDNGTAKGPYVQMVAYRMIIDGQVFDCFPTKSKRDENLMAALDAFDAPQEEATEAPAQAEIDPEIEELPY